MLVKKCSMLLTALICVYVFKAGLGIDAQESFRFAFAYQTEDGFTGIGFFDPRQVGVENSVTVDLRQNSWLLSQVAQSTGHEWIAIELGIGGGRRMLKVANSLTLVVRDISRAYIEPYISPSLAGPQEHIVWSPDGQFLAFNISETTAQGTANTTRVYSTRDDSLTNLTLEGMKSMGLAWSLDSRQLAISAVNCTVDCAAFVNVFDIETRSWGQSTDLTPDVFGANSRGLGGICNLNWSPDSRHITFMANCDQLEYGYYKEIYLLDAEQQTVQRITDFTYRQNIIEQQGFVAADYSLAWLDSDNLIISVVHGLGSNIRAETFIYTLSTGISDLISETFATSLALNPNSKTIAQVMSPVSNVTGQNVVVTRLDDVPNGSRNLDQQLVSPVLPQSCSLTWSPDGAYLAYSVPLRTRSCLAPLHDFNLLDAESWQPIDVPMPSETSTTIYSIPIGWVP